MGSELRVLALDLSLRSSGACVIGGSWDLDFSKCHTEVFGIPLARDALESERIARLQALERHVMRLIHTFKPTHAVVEQYAYGVRNGQPHSLGELGGVVKLRLSKEGIPVHVISPSAARQILGKFPRKGAKEACHIEVYRMGAPKWWGPDEIDAWVLGNALLAELGGCAIAVGCGGT